MPLAPNQRLAHYRLIEPLGEGGMGVVWKAEDTRLGRLVALKFLPAEVATDPERQRMFLEEARLASSLSDARIAQVHDVGEEGGHRFIAMELVEGKPLDKLLHGRPLPAEKVVALGLQVAQALSRAHRRGLLHRDVKPANVMVTADGEVKLVDFGLAAMLAPPVPSSDPQRTQPPGATSRPQVAAGSGTGGTLAYMSPEAIRGEALDARSDLYSLGVALYEMTTGQKPYRGRTDWEVVEEVLRGRAEPVHALVPKVPVELERIVLKTLAAKPNERYQTTDDLVVDLKRLAKELETDSSPSYADIRGRLAEKEQRTLWLRVGAGVAGVLVVAVVLAWWRGPWRATRLDAKTVVVLPFEVQGQTEGAEYVGRALAQAVTVNLATAKELTVLPVPRALHVAREDERGLAREARRLGAGRYLTGMMTRLGDSVQVSVSLVESRGNRLMWGVVETADGRNLPGVAATLGREAIGQLGVQAPKLYDYILTLLGSPAMAISPLTARVQAALMRADIDSSLVTSEQLCRRFPNEPDAAAMRAFALMDAWVYRGSAAGLLKEMNRTLEGLERLDPRSPYPDLVLALFERSGGRAHEAIKRYDRLLRRQDLTPRCRAHVLGQRGATLTTLGEFREADQQLLEVLALDPTGATAHGNRSRNLLALGRGQEALAEADLAVALQPKDGRLRQRRGLALVAMGRMGEAADAMGMACELGRSQSQCADFAVALFKAGRKSEARAAAVVAERLTPGTWGLFNLAQYWTLAGNKAQAFRCLHKALDLGFGDTELFSEHNLDGLRSDPEFQRIAAEVKRRLAKN